MAEPHPALRLSRGAVSSASSRHQSEGGWSPAGRAPVSDAAGNMVMGATEGDRGAWPRRLDL